MLRTLCRSRIHRATVTGAGLNYVGPITSDRSLPDTAEYQGVFVFGDENNRVARDPLRVLVS
jgi:aspartate 1-decarboxylase